MTTKTLKIISRLRKLAARSSCEYKLGSMVMRGRQILSEGFNKWRMTCNLGRQYSEYDSIHAEIDAMRQIRRSELVGTTIYVARFTKNGDYANSKPCKCCDKAIRDLGIRKIIYTQSEFPFIREEII